MTAEQARIIATRIFEEQDDQKIDQEDLDVAGPDVNGDFAARYFDHRQGLVVYSNSDYDEAWFDVWPPHPGTIFKGEVV